ncbi:hypothetical protein [Acetobacter sp.]|uniref:hypothetical protein n=1 Tax=Acetobacter sp. TaxID=440 RepID=UPI0025BECF6A|nr:hypothetical protein [Acetobacter sp.]MCH4091016.1 hypothetical protein [Acetobacter sp.]MCI1300199.1 hypothetical protein [Acetobacter sp.]MCI1316133.1 hypothetical protein [Acetobacter sp.]
MTVIVLQLVGCPLESQLPFSRYRQDRPLVGTELSQTRPYVPSRRKGSGQVWFQSV